MQKFGRGRFLGLVGESAGLLVLLLGVLDSAPAQAGFAMKRLALTGVADRLSSPSYNLTVTAVTTGGATGVCPSGAVASLGFWSVRGPMVVPVRLTVNKSASDAFNVDLSWSGQSSAFEIYRSISPVDLVSPENLFQTTGTCRHHATGTTDRNVRRLLTQSRSVPSTRR